MLVDDLKLYEEIKERLQEAVEVVGNVTDTIGMSVGSEVCHCIHVVGASGPPRPPGVTQSERDRRGQGRRELRISGCTASTQNRSP